MNYPRFDTKAEARSAARRLISEMGFGHLVEYDNCIAVNDRGKTFKRYYYDR